MFLVLVLHRIRISLPLLSCESPAHSTAGLVLQTGAGARRNRSEGEEKVHPGLGPKLPHSMMDSRSSRLLPDGKGTWMRRKKPLLAPSGGVHTPCVQLE